ncbi:MAG TPA: dockerin type I repeat-containing protein [Longimicrobium sp.]|jgi:hypothetical protein|uniref:dockerin type I repeat-containing protein n=1 Tax=Longimicrobium sp. TaxID=2029185 RepID=UPI002ED9407F
MNNPRTERRGRYSRARRLAAALAAALALGSCADAMVPGLHDRDGWAMQLSPATRAELESPRARTLELRFDAGDGPERVQSFQGEIRFDAARYRVAEVTAPGGVSLAWHSPAAGRIRFAGVAVDGIQGTGLVVRFEDGASFRAADFQLSIEEAILRPNVEGAAFIRAGDGQAATPAGPATSSHSAAVRTRRADAASSAVDLRGDVNGDGAMTAVDALAILAHAAGKPLPASFTVSPQGDLSRDGAVTALDALLVLEYRVGRDRAVSVTITTAPRTIDVTDSLVLAVELRGVRGEMMGDSVRWTCPDAALVRECGPRFVRPAITPLAAPRALKVIASAGIAADTLEASVFEAAMDELRVDLHPYPGAVSTRYPQSQVHAVRALPGGITAVHVTAHSGGGNPQLRPFRLVVGDTTVFSARLGPGRLDGTPVLVTGRTAGTSVLTVLVNGVSLAVRVEVAAPALASCSPTATLSLDMAPGDIRTFRGSDPGAPGCLDFRAGRDRGRQYMVLTYLLPYSTGKQPNDALESFNFEGQGLFHGAGEAVPAAYPVFRFHTAGLNAAALPAASPAPRSDGNARARAPAWREGTPRRERAVRQVRPAARTAGAGAARLNVSVAGVEQALVAVGDTLVGAAFALLDPGVRTSDGAPASDRAIVTYVGQNLVLAEHADVLLGRLVGPGGHAARRIPLAEYPKLDEAYGGSKRQLDRLFGGAYGGTVAGRNGGGRDLALNMPLQSGVWGWARGDLTVIDYWFGTQGGPPAMYQQPLRLAESLLAHEFAHVRHFQQWTGLDAPVGPWIVEGFADFAPQLAFAARALKSETPSRTGHVAVPLVGTLVLPSMHVSPGNSLFRGYDDASFLFAYLADQVEAAGGDGLRAARDLALSAHSRTQAEAAVRRHLPALSLTDVVARAEAVRYLEFLRRPQACGGRCNTSDVPAALAISPDLPAHTRYLQFDLPAMAAPVAHGPERWLIARPGAAFGTAYQLRTGGSWPIFIDGTDPLGDAQYLIDLSSEPQAVFSVVRIR